MISPLYALLGSALLAAALVLLFRRRRGIFWQWREMRRMTERVLIEDALKHLYDCEYRGRRPTVQSLSGTMEVPGGQAAGIMGRLEAQGLVKSEGEDLQLTPDGRDYALRVVRLHRLWERYLSDRSGLSEADWHGEAERREHRTSAAEAEAMSRQMGHPLYDPHGDPIPTVDGEIPPRRGQPLTSLPAGEAAVIVHLEDEPAQVYAQIAAEGLRPGTSVRMMEATPERIRFWADGDERILAPVAAANVSVVPVPSDGSDREESRETLASLRPGEAATVIRISKACRGLERRRLLDLGILPGTRIEAAMKSPSGDPTAYRVRGTLVALRDEQAGLIHVGRTGEAER